MRCPTSRPSPKMCPRRTGPNSNARHSTRPKGRRAGAPRRSSNRIVRERGFKTLTRIREDVAEVAYQPTACHRTYRLIIVRQTIQVEEGQARLFDEIHYRFSLTNDRQATPRALAFKANDRCDQENLIAQLKGGV